MYQPPTAHRCGHRDHKPITVITEGGSHMVCQLCALGLLSEAGRRVEVSLVMAPLRANVDA